MSTTILTAATNLLNRVRSPNGEGLSSTSPPSYASGKAFAYSILSQAQRYVNTLEQVVVDTIPYVLTPYQTVYSIDSDPVLGTGGSSPIIKIIGVRDGDRDLIFSPFHQLWQSDFGWFRANAQRPVTWSQFGRDTLIIYPAPNMPFTVNLIVLPYIADMVADTDTFSVTDDTIPIVMDVAEALALFKLGEYKRCLEVIKRVSENYTNELASDHWIKKMSQLQ